ncbi:substrate-binding domain-containing protein [Sphingobacterium sp. UT-1RO-CII-1]|uniref:PstS family phosphate ABC transporter substrate-binding protein n=1 Tax=Sphingobacterium sp. UT-1RO-CII-1 TaxID=2995225 RepID=UPI00227D2CB6|nr:substrate-binding domain-containing protein [Sphingobacterium sp. UT-1RO-CII-1]MCY4778929.1 substrate-binding domain-containing protein [Sphingobacterium sp. UT-1RO-CII-1]
MIKVLIYSVLCCFLISGCAPKIKETYDSEKGYVGSISISGAFALYPIVVLWSEDFKKIHPHVRFNISAGGAGKGIADVLSNMVEIGLVSRDLHPQEIAKGALPIHVAQDAVLGTINSNHPDIALIRKRGFTPTELRGIFVEKRYKNWRDIDSAFIDAPIEVYTRSDAAGAAETWAKFLGETQEGLHGIGIFSDPSLAQLIKEKETAIGFNNINYVYDLKTKTTSPGITVVPIDKNANGKIDPEEDFYMHLDTLTSAIRDKRYPSPPTRDLTFVIRSGQHSPLLKAFIEFVLSSENQGYLLENGYVPLDQLKNEIERQKIAHEI